jgi:hypothetical protein
MSRKKQAGGGNPGKDLFENFLNALAQDAAALDFKQLQEARRRDDDEREKRAPPKAPNTSASKSSGRSSTRARANRAPP